MKFCNHIGDDEFSQTDVEVGLSQKMNIYTSGRELSLRTPSPYTSDVPPVIAQQSLKSYQGHCAGVSYLRTDGSASEFKTGQGPGLNAPENHCRNPILRDPLHIKGGIIQRIFNVLRQCAINELKIQPHVRRDMWAWKESLEINVEENFRDLGEYGYIKTEDIYRGIHRALKRLVPTFLGVLVVLNDGEEAPGARVLLIEEGWKFLKSHMEAWKKISGSQIIFLQQKNASKEYEDHITPIITLKYLINLDLKSPSLSLPIHGLLQEWTRNKEVENKSSKSTEATLLDKIQELKLLLMMERIPTNFYSHPTFEILHMMIKTRENQENSLVKWSQPTEVHKSLVTVYPNFEMLSKKKMSLPKKQCMKKTKKRLEGIVSGTIIRDGMTPYPTNTLSSKYKNQNWSRYSFGLLQHCCLNQIESFPDLMNAIVQWFLNLDHEIFERFISQGVKIKPLRSTLSHGLERARKILLLHFLSYLVILDNEIEEKNTPQILMHEGWRYFKIHFEEWTTVIPGQILSAEKDQSSGYFNLTDSPLDTLVKLMSDTKITLDSFDSLLCGWLDWKHSPQKSLSLKFSHSQLLEKVEKNCQQIDNLQISLKKQKKMSFEEIKRKLAKTQGHQPQN